MRNRKVIALIFCISIMLCISGCSKEKATMQDNLRAISNECIKVPLNDNLIEENNKIHEVLKEYNKVASEEALESIYYALNYLKKYDIASVSAQSAYSAKEYNDLDRNYWELDVTGLTTYMKGRVVLRLCTDEKGVIESCIIKSQQIESTRAE